MGKRGPKPTPRAILKLRGSRRADYNPDQPDAPVEKPTMPRGLTPGAQHKWQELVPELLELGVLARIDGTMLAAFCQAWAQAHACEQWIAKHGSIRDVYDENGRPISVQAWPQVRELQQLREYLNRVGAEFGLTPSGRTRITVAGKPKLDKLDEFLAGKVG